jgi:hypothetical protein
MARLQRKIAEAIDRLLTRFFLLELSFWLLMIDTGFNSAGGLRKRSVDNERVAAMMRKLG